MSKFLELKLKEMIEKDEFTPIANQENSSLLNYINSMIEVINEERRGGQACQLQVDQLKDDSHYRKQFVHILCHDLLNPIGKSYSFLNVLGEDEDINVPFYDEITRGVKYSIDIIKEVQQLLSLQDGKLKIDLEFVNLKEIVDESLKMLDHKIKDKNITLDYDVDSSLIVLSNKSFAVLSVVNNILTNAIKFSQNGGTIHIEASVNQSCVELKIRDHGVGIPPKILEDIFDSTKKTTRVGTAGEEGTGFGMPLVKKFMEAFEGQININSDTSEENHGTEVSLLFWKGM